MSDEQHLNSEENEKLGEWYTASQAAKKLSETSGKEIKPDYLFKLGHLKRIRTKKLSTRVTLYNKKDVDSYKVGGRGRKPANTDKKSNAA